MNALLHIPFSPSLFVVKSIHAKKETNNKMVSIRFGIFVFAIIFMLLNTIAYSLQDAQMVLVRDKFAEEEIPLSSRQKKVTHNVASAMTETLVNRKILGRRMLVKMVNEEHINGEEMLLKKASSSSSSGNHRKGGHKATKRSKTIDHNDHDDNHHVKMSSTFMALNSDYHVPRSHPPKNN